MFKSPPPLCNAAVARKVDGVWITCQCLRARASGNTDLCSVHLGRNRSGRSVARYAPEARMPRPVHP